MVCSEHRRGFLEKEKNLNQEGSIKHAKTLLRFNKEILCIHSCKDFVKRSGKLEIVCIILEKISFCILFSSL